MSARVAALLLSCLGLAACDKGDWFPLERSARALFNGWDMWHTEASGPHKRAWPGTPPGTVPLGGKVDFAGAQRDLQRLDAAARPARARLAYRRYCGHCHGENGDGRSVVGESFATPLPDLRKIGEPDDEQLYGLIMDGGGNMLSLRGTLTPLEALLSLVHLRTLASAPSRPVFAPQDVVPLE